MKTMLYSDDLSDPEVEVTQEGVTVSCVLAQQREIAQMVNRYSSVLSIPNVATNFSADKAILYVSIPDTSILLVYQSSYL